MDKLLANLNIMYTKIHNFHYNIIGVNALAFHVQLEGEYDFMHETIDLIAERMKAIDHYPKASLKEYLQLSTIKEVESKDYKSTVVLPILIEDYNELINNIEEIRRTADGVTCSVLDGIQENLEKKLWLFKIASK